MPETITSPQNEKLKLVRRLADRRGRGREHLFISEGEDLLEAGLRAGLEPEFVLAAEGEAPSEGAIPVLGELLERVSTMGSGSRVIAVWPLPEAVGRDRKDEGGTLVYLDGVADPGNVGAIIRTAAALGGCRVALGPGCADPYGPRAVRASMGALFGSHPIPDAGLEGLPRPRLALAAHGGEDLDRALAAGLPACVCLGAERLGLAQEALDACDAVATIPLSPGAESLNVAATAAIVLHRISSIARGAGTRVVGNG